MTVETGEFARRRSGLLVPGRSMPGDDDYQGTYGETSREFLKLMQESGFNILHDLPITPPDKNDCPYSSVSAFALDMQRIDLEKLVESGDLPRAELTKYQTIMASGDRGPEIRDVKSNVMRLAATKFMQTASPERQGAFETWRAAEASWLEPYATFEILKGLPGNEGKRWQDWGVGKDCTPGLIDAVKKCEELEFTTICYEQWIAEQQALEYQKLANQFGVELWGDVPFYVGEGEVWANRDLFNLDAEGNQLSKGGCPPDDFSETGQMWGNATYNVNFGNQTTTNKVIDWWVRRLERTRKISGTTRLDHVIGLAEPWIIPADRHDGIVGRRTPGLGFALLDTLSSKGPLGVYAEDLGEKNAKAEELMRRYELLCTRVGVFALQASSPADFDDSEHNPANFNKRTVGFTSNHDTPTLGQTVAAMPPDMRQHLASQMSEQLQGIPTNEQLIKAIIARTFGSAAMVAITTPWDLLNLGKEGRYNVPGKVDPSNWSWRMSPQEFAELKRKASELRALNAASSRLTA